MSLSTRKQLFWIVGVGLGLVTAIAITIRGTTQPVPLQRTDSSQTAPASSGHLGDISKVTANSVVQAPPRAPLNKATFALPASDGPIHGAFEQALKCHSSALLISNLQGQVVACEAESDNPSDAAFYASCKEKTKERLQQIQAETDKLASCGNMTAEQINAGYYHAVVDAARAGDVDAQICYFQGDFGHELSEEEIEQYKGDVVPYAKAALMRGDWRIAALLTTTPADQTALMSHLPFATPAEIYNMNRLLRLGATGEYADILDTLAENQKSRLTPEGIARANAWAQAEYKKSFANSPPLSSEPVPCNYKGS